MEDAEVLRFVRRINRRSKNVGKNAALATKIAAKEMLTEVVLATPVDTGRARSNWRVGVGSPKTGVVEPYAPGRHLGLGDILNAAGAINAGSALIDSSTGDEQFYITNNVPYIYKLDNGWSNQAPANFIRMALDRASARVRRIRLLD